MFEQKLRYLIKGTPLETCSINELIIKVSQNFKKISANARNQRNSFDNKLDELKNDFGEKSPAYKAVGYRKGQFLQKFVLNYLAEENFFT